MTLWIMRGLLVLWALYAVFFLESGEEAMWGKMAFVAPAIAVLAVIEFVAWRARVKKAFRELARDLNLSFDGGIGSIALNGTWDGFEITLRTNQNSDIGPGTHLEILLPKAVGMAIGARRIERRLKRAASGAARVEGLPPALGDVVAFGGPAALTFLSDPEHTVAVADFVSRWGGAVLDDRVAGVDMANQHSKEALLAFLASGLDVAHRAVSASVQPDGQHAMLAGGGSSVPEAE